MQGMQSDDANNHESGRNRHGSLCKSYSRQSVEEAQDSLTKHEKARAASDVTSHVVHIPAIDSVLMHTGYSTPAQDRELNVPSTQEYVSREKTPQHKQYERPTIFTKMFFKRAIVMSLWFFTSFTGIVLNKYILTGLDVDPGVLGECQIVMTTFLGACMMYIPVFGLKKSSSSNRNDYFNRYQFFKTISILGCLRCGAIICSVVALKYVAVSFSETVKSSAPLFTAIIAYLILGEYSGVFVNLSLVPIMFGLAISTSSELSFNMTGFLAAVINNLLDCIQNVFSKKLLSGDEHRFSPLELQFYTSVAASIVQMPLWFFFMDIHEKINDIDQHTAGVLVLNGFVFYSQSLFAYLLMSLISPVTFSVSNTVKRACLIWFSTIVFNNKVTKWSAFGTCLVVAGVFLYQHARHIEEENRKKIFNELKHDGRNKLLPRPI